MAQTTLFSEDFDTETAQATSGSSVEGISWTVSCPACSGGQTTGDHLWVENGGLEGQDTNGPATFSTGAIDATGCYLVTFSFTYTAPFGYSGSGNFECPADCGATCLGDVNDPTGGACDGCWDFLYGELDLGANIERVILLGDDCNDGPNGSVTSSPVCASPYDANGDLIPGNDPTAMQLNIVMSMWAGDENMTIDNIMVLCYTEEEATTAGLTAPANCNPPPVTNACDANEGTFPSAVGGGSSN